MSQNASPQKISAAKSLAAQILPAACCLLLSLGATAYIHWTASTQGLRDASALFASDWDHHVAEAKHTFEESLNLTYDAIRTMAMLPGVSSIDRYAKNFEGDPRLTVQQLYNDVASHVPVSEIYIVPADLEPDQFDPVTGKTQIPITTFDHIIVGKNADNQATESEDSKLEEVEIYEYRSMKVQNQYFRTHYPTKDSIKGLAYPALTSPEVITCDNTEFSARDLAAHNDAPRHGFVYSVPFYGPDGKYKGMISAVLRTWNMARLFKDPYFVASNPDSHFDIPADKAAPDLLTSINAIRDGNPPANIAYTATHKCSVVDGHPWILCAAVPDSVLQTFPAYRARAARSNLIFFSGLALSALLSLVVWSISTTGARAQALATRMTTELSRSEARFRTLVQNIPGAVYRISLDDKLSHGEFISSQIHDLLGLPAEAMANAVSKTLAAAIEPQDLPPLTAARRAAAENQQRINVEYRIRDANGQTHWVHDQALPFCDPQTGTQWIDGVMLDITARKNAEAEREHLQQRLLEASRQAGMADIATGVLHNVGNVLNSVTVSTQAIRDTLQVSQLSNLGRAVAMIDEHTADLGNFLTFDEKGKRLPGFLGKLAATLTREREAVTEELANLGKSIEHIQQIVGSQQQYAKPHVAEEQVDLKEVLEDAVRMNLPSFSRHGVELVRHYQEVPKVLADKHLVMQILVNLVGNAKHAVKTIGQNEPKRITLTIEKHHSDDRDTVRVIVADNGMGIAAENLSKIFAFGFTTKKEGHGFGLHSSANAAAQMRGKLTTTSQGPGKGAEFLLELPIQPVPANAGESA